MLTVSFDPTHDQPKVLRKYAGVWKADAHSSHFLTGPPAEVQRVCDMFGLDAFLDEGLMDHSLHTVVIDQNGNLAANVEGNQFTADQLGELIQTVLDRGR
jgi:protein SCO1/2